ncbi:HBL263Wp [Eremothecium sinecaudum]|uniref:HBL263Wp n=1 Tax=Eremothecium sinecaudum TaxID=45286 RepID=A0A109UW74_9SACH|nr:HBL263Wp [Eremothecium sinecaudum]AMD18639.1 HBL263Wp [Eremothecium sinecaudum]
MEGLKRTWKQLVYTFSTDDRYAEYNPNDPMQGSGASDSRMFDCVNGSQIQLNDFSDESESRGNDGVSECLLAWRHISSWCTEHNSDLYATLSAPCTKNDIARAEADLSVTFPAAVRASLRLHDGQEDMESMQGVSGLLYGLKLMSLDEIVRMTCTWRSVAAQLAAQELRNEQSKDGSSTDNERVGVMPKPVDQKGYMKVSKEEVKSTTDLQKNLSQNHSKRYKMNHIPRQASVPPLAIQCVYAHPGWVPLVTDKAGNHIGIDLAPGPKGKYAQVIMFGREFDTKYVVGDNWGDFLLSFVNDLENGNWVLVDNTDDYLNGDGELMFVEKGTNGPILDYFSVLKKRSWDKWQRQKPMPAAPKSKPANTASLSSQDSVSNATLPKNSLYASTTAVDETLTSQDDPVIMNENTLEASGDSVNTEHAEDDDGSHEEGSTTLSVTQSNADSIVAKGATSINSGTTNADEDKKSEVLHISKSQTLSQGTSRLSESDAVEELHDEFENVAL